MANRVSLKRLYNLNKQTGEPFFGDLSHFDFMTGYVMDHEYLDRNFMKQHASFCPRWNLQEEKTEADVLDVFKQDVYDLLIKNEENYKRLYQIVESKYNPVYNYDRHEVTIDTHGGTDKVTDNIGEVNETNNIGQVKNTANYGEINGTNNYGELNVSDSVGAQTQTGVDSIAGFNSSDFNNAGKNEQTASSRSDTHHESAKTDTNKVEAHVDSNTTDARVDTNKIDARENIQTTIHGMTINHKSDIEGNIGVTTATAMLTEHYEFWHDLFNFYEGVYQDIITHLCTIYDNAPEAFQSFYGGECIDVI